MNYINHPVTNAHAKTRSQAWTDLDLDEFLDLMGILLSMEMYETHGLRTIYFNTEGTNKSCLQELVRHLPLSFAKDDDKEILKSLEAINFHFRKCLTADFYLTLDESIIKLTEI